MSLQSSTYYQQSQGLNNYSPYEVDILKNADLSIKLRETSKIGTVIGLVTSTASVVFNYDPTTLLIVTSVSAIAWFGLHKLSQYLEPKAQTMIEELQQRPPNTQDNRPAIRFSTRQELAKSKQRLINNLTS